MPFDRIRVNLSNDRRIAVRKGPISILMRAKRQPPCESVLVGVYAPTKVRKKSGLQFPGREVFGAYTEDGEWGTVAPCRPWDILTVPEPYGIVNYVGFPESVIRASKVVYRDDKTGERPLRWESEIRMPSQYIRLLLDVTDCRFLKVNSLSNTECLLLGFEGQQHDEGHGNVSFTEPWQQLRDHVGHGFYDDGKFVWIISARMR